MRHALFHYNACICLNHNLIIIIFAKVNMLFIPVLHHFLLRILSCPPCLLTITSCLSCVWIWPTGPFYNIIYISYLFLLYTRSICFSLKLWNLNCKTYDARAVCITVTLIKIEYCTCLGKNFMSYLFYYCGQTFKIL